jgi:hypothetical protein
VTNLKNKSSSQIELVTIRQRVATISRGRSCYRQLHAIITTPLAEEPALFNNALVIIFMVDSGIGGHESID